MTYVLFDTTINRVMGVYESEQEALAYVRALLSVNDADFADDLALAKDLGGGRPGEPLSGAELVARVGEAVTGGERVIA